MITHIFIRGWVLSMITVNLDAQNPVLTKCLPGGDKCYYLYRADRTWQMAYNACLSRNQHLATIQDEQTQSIMKQFATDQVYIEESAHAWVAGRRSDDTTWRHLDGTAFHHDGSISSEGVSSRLCMLLTGEPGLAADADLHQAVSCYGNTAFKAVCEYDPPGSGCPNDTITIHQPSVNKCNTVSGRYRSCQDARQYCQSKDWELAHTGAGSWHFYVKLTLTDKPLIRDETAFWIGVQRKPWVWKTDASLKIYPTVTYWRSQEDGNSDEDCMHIELNDQGLWADKQCDATSAHFICQNYMDQTTQAPSLGSTTTQTTTTLISRSSTTGTPTTRPPSINNSTNNIPTVPTTESQDVTSDLTSTEPPSIGTSMKTVTVYIIIGVVGGVLVAVIIVVVVVCIRRKKRKEGVPSENANLNTGPPSDSTHTDINDEDPQPYAEFTTISKPNPTEDSYDLPLYDEAAAVQKDKLQTPEVYQNVPDVKAPGNPGLSRVDPGHVITEEGDGPITGRCYIISFITSPVLWSWLPHLSAEI